MSLRTKIYQTLLTELKSSPTGKIVMSGPERFASRVPVEIYTDQLLVQLVEHKSWKEVKTRLEELGDSWCKRQGICHYDWERSGVESRPLNEEERCRYFLRSIRDVQELCVVPVHGRFKIRCNPDEDAEWVEDEASHLMSILELPLE